MPVEIPAFHTNASMDIDSFIGPQMPIEIPAFRTNASMDIDSFFEAWSHVADTDLACSDLSLCSITDDESEKAEKVCRNCGEHGHSRKECQGCWGCGATDHIRRDCPNPRPVQPKVEATIQRPRSHSRKSHWPKSKNSNHHRKPYFLSKSRAAYSRPSAHYQHEYQRYEQQVQATSRNLYHNNSWT